MPAASTASTLDLRTDEHEGAQGGEACGEVEVVRMRRRRAHYHETLTMPELLLATLRQRRPPPSCCHWQCARGGVEEEKRALAIRILERNRART